MKIGILNGYDEATGLYNNGELLPKSFIQFSEILDEDYTEITSISAWEKYGAIGFDYDRYRYEMKILFFNKAGQQLENFSTLTTEEKYLGAKHFFLPYNMRLLFLTEQQDYNNWEYLVEETQGIPTVRYRGRAKTFDMMRKCVSHNVRKEIMSLANSQQMLKDVGSFADWYIRANAPDLKQWIINEVGSPYENDGFYQKSYFSSQLRDDLYNIYNGNY